MFELALNDFLAVCEPEFAILKNVMYFLNFTSDFDICFSNWAHSHTPYRD